MGNQTYTYYWNGSQLAAMTVKRNTTVIATMRFYYDAEGVPFYFDYNGTKYFYITNLQGDVVGLANEHGIVATYAYDAWGKIISTSGITSMEESALYYNPLRYRGYIYDTETGFYYLQTRYYDPSIGRFINADGYVSTGTSVLGYNMFAYCENDPVMGCDPKGASLMGLIIFIVATAIVCAVIEGVDSYNEAVEANNDDDPTNDKDVFIETIKGVGAGFAEGLLISGAIVCTGGVGAGLAGTTFMGALAIDMVA